MLKCFPCGANNICVSADSSISMWYDGGRRRYGLCHALRGVLPEVGDLQRSSEVAEPSLMSQSPVERKKNMSVTLWKMCKVY